MQAEAQFRYDRENPNKISFYLFLFPLYSVLKDRKKTDKTIIDSQERAFWRVMRPSVSILKFSTCAFVH